MGERRKASSVVGVVLCAVLMVPLAVQAGQASTFKISSFYVNSPGTLVAVWTTSPQVTINPAGAGCAGGTFVNNAMVFIPDYSSTAKAESSRQIINTLNTAFLAGKTVYIYSGDCVVSPWNALQRVATIYDVQVW